MNNNISTIDQTPANLIEGTPFVADTNIASINEASYTYSVLEEGSLAEAYFDTMKLVELEKMLLDGPDQLILKSWNMTENEWVVQINVAIEAIKKD